MLQAKDIQSGNMLDVDSNLKNIYQQTDSLRQTQPVTVYARNNTSQYGGYNSSYTQIMFTATTANIATSALSFNLSDSTFNVDSNVFSDFEARFTMQYYTDGAPSDSTIYIRFVGIREDNSESVVNPFYRVPVGTVTSDKFTLVSFNQLFSVDKDIKKLKVMVATNSSIRPSVQNATVSLSGICKTMN